jgi:hypothetical protein
MRSRPAVRVKQGIGSSFCNCETEKKVAARGDIPGRPAIRGSWFVRCFPAVPAIGDKGLART